MGYVLTILQDWLLVGYATIYTAAPVLSLVLDKDVDENLANLYPELYKELTTGRSLSYRTFFVWVFVSIYQGSMIQGLSQILTEVNGNKMVAVSYTVLVLNELIMVAIEITTWHPVMIISILGTFLVFVGSVPFLGRYFDLQFVITWFVPLPTPLTISASLTAFQGVCMAHFCHWSDFVDSAVCGQINQKSN